MAKQPTPTAAAPTPTPIKPVKAVQRITYGANVTVEPGTIFTPVSAAERAELLVGDNPAAVELDETETKLFAASGDDSGSDFG